MQLSLYEVILYNTFMNIPYYFNTNRLDIFWMRIEKMKI